MWPLLWPLTDTARTEPATAEVAAECLLDATKAPGSYVLQLLASSYLTCAVLFDNAAGALFPLQCAKRPAWEQQAVQVQHTLSQHIHCSPITCKVYPVIHLNRGMTAAKIPHINSWCDYGQEEPLVQLPAFSGECLDPPREL